MKIYEIINFHRELLECLTYSGVNLRDVRYIDLFADYLQMLSSGEKVSYTIAMLAEKYEISERKVYSLVKSFKSNVDLVQPKRIGKTLIRINGNIHLQ